MLSRWNLGSSFFVKHSPGCCKVFIRLQNLKKLISIVFFQLNCCFSGGTGFWNDLICHFQWHHSPDLHFKGSTDYCVNGRLSGGVRPGSQLQWWDQTWEHLGPGAEEVMRSRQSSGLFRRWSRLFVIDLNLGHENCGAEKPVELEGWICHYWPGFLQEPPNWSLCSMLSLLWCVLNRAARVSLSKAKWVCVTPLLLCPCPKPILSPAEPCIIWLTETALFTSPNSLCFSVLPCWPHCGSSNSPYRLLPQSRCT